jgi:23S rRNA (guanine1835-N2)-methyltransferase
MTAATPEPDVLRVPQGEFRLRRHPERDGDPLRAWDGADEMLLAHLAGFDLVTGERSAPVPIEGTVAVVNDAWGALTTALGNVGANLATVSDSALAQTAARANLARNGLDIDLPQLGPLDPLPARIDLALVRIPRTLALLELELSRLAGALAPGATVIGTAMTKDVHTSTLEAFERWVGTTRTTRSARKARLVLASRDTARDGGDPGWPRTFVAPPGLGQVSGAVITNHAGVFSAQHLDHGARFLLETMHARLGAGDGPVRRVLDLGCGNGVVGLAAALADPAAEVMFVDESHLALASARATVAANAPGAHAGFALGGTLAEAGIAPESMDLVLNNPPFHAHRGVTDATAWAMFLDARRALRRGGRLWVVGNRHLGYHIKLKRAFGNCTTVAANPKFVVLQAVR